MKPANILLVEDNEGDIFLTTEALEDSNHLSIVNIARNGKEALDYVFRNGKFNNATTPDLILLDINLPIKNGLEVLKTIKNNDLVKQIPIIMLTTSSSQKDINTCYREHANSYIPKPVDANDLENIINTIGKFWLNTVSLPTRKREPNEN